MKSANRDKIMTLILQTTWQLYFKQKIKKLAFWFYLQYHKFDKCKSFTWEETISKKKITSSSTGEEVNILGPWQIYSSCFSTRGGADIGVETPFGIGGSVTGPGHQNLQFLHLQHRQNQTGSAHLPCWHLPRCHQVSDCPQSVASFLAFSFLAAGLRGGWKRAGANGFVQTEVRPYPSLSSLSISSISLHVQVKILTMASRDLDPQTLWPFSCFPLVPSTPAVLAPVLLLELETSVQSTCSLYTAPSSPRF